MSLHAHGGQFNVGGIKNDISVLGTDFSKLEDSRFQGWFVGAGLGYGYAWMWGRHWNMEFELGLGYAYSEADEFRCTGCGKKLREDVPHHYFGLSKAAVALVYLF